MLLLLASSFGSERQHRVAEHVAAKRGVRGEPCVDCREHEERSGGGEQEGGQPLPGIPDVSAFDVHVSAFPERQPPGWAHYPYSRKRARQPSVVETVT